MGTLCESCVYYVYDEEADEYDCEADMDEDDYYRFLTDERSGCPLYREDSEYKVVAHQM